MFYIVGWWECMVVVKIIRVINLFLTLSRLGIILILRKWIHYIRRLRMMLIMWDLLTIITIGRWDIQLVIGRIVDSHQLSGSNYKTTITIAIHNITLVL